MKIHISRANLLAITLTSIAATAPAFAQSAPTKATFTSKKYGFSLYLPTTPQVVAHPKPPEMGGGTLEVFVAKAKPIVYTVVPIILPAKVAKMATSQTAYFDGVQTGILAASKKMKGKAVSSRTIQVNGQTVRAFVASFESPIATSKTPVKFISETRSYKIGARTYQFGAVAPATDFAKNQAQIRKVLDSVVIAK